MAVLTPILVLAGGLSSINRFSMEKLAHRESVLEHVGMVSLFALAIGTELSRRGVDLDLGAVLSRAISHDVDEVITGDIARPTKYASRESSDMFRELSLVAINKIHDRLKNGGLEGFADVLRYSFEWAKGSDVEGAIVALADILAIVAKVRDEVIIRNNLGMVRQARTAFRQLRTFREQRIALHFSGPASSFLSEVVYEAECIMLQAERFAEPDDVEEY